ncbi:hypothetical protein DESHY_110027 [Desulforamulus hydrothermalis Lam5 = DSM 18033]|uniref:Uncharacterized protein n=1 Tax=Desulforamulus hydrothermalis Lam5 = DSM 18033 TaxID=1121428 RepID=K8E6H5_9FIRM|nr:hypothetical protein DESHY_110027 [Desulforamulus hydrothermalis Lam5 = DSM 18033]
MLNSPRSLNYLIRRQINRINRHTERFVGLMKYKRYKKDNVVIINGHIGSDNVYYVNFYSKLFGFSLLLFSLFFCPVDIFGIMDKLIRLFMAFDFYIIHCFRHGLIM